MLTARLAMHPQRGGVAGGEEKVYRRGAGGFGEEPLFRGNAQGPRAGADRDEYAVVIMERVVVLMVGEQGDGEIGSEGSDREEKFARVGFGAAYFAGQQEDRVYAET